MNKKQILQKLRNDEDYYGDFGNQFLSIYIITHNFSLLHFSTLLTYR